MRSTDHPDYVYRPATAETRAKMSAAHRRRLGIPDGKVRIYGQHVLEKHSYPLAYYASWIRQRQGMDAAVRYVRRFLRTRKLQRPMRGVRGQLPRGHADFAFYVPRDDLKAKWTGHFERKKERQADRIARMQELAELVSFRRSHLTSFGQTVPRSKAYYARHAQKMATLKSHGREGAIEFLQEAAASNWTMPLPELKKIRSQSVDWDLVEGLLIEGASIADVSAFLHVRVEWIERKLLHRKEAGVGLYRRTARRGA